MKAKDIMTTPVITVAPDTLVLYIAVLLLERQITAVGLVGEGDLVHRYEMEQLLSDLAIQSWWR